MFVVGKEYKIRMNDGTGQSSINATVLEVGMPLIVVGHDYGELIINTSSLGFVSAQRDDQDTRACKQAKNDEWLDSVGRVRLRRT